MSTNYHAKYFAHALLRRSASDNLDKFGTSLLSAAVDLNPHQIDAALFAFRSPLSRGAILADEVGLGKTIEAGLIISQLWAEQKRRTLIIVPTTLRKQWAQELWEKFYIPSSVLDSRALSALAETGGPAAAFDHGTEVVIVSYHFARSCAEAISRVPWDLVVIDEAHRLRNVYRSDSKIARDIRTAVSGRPKILLTATPLQNTLLELFGLVGFLDEHVFGDEASFRARYLRGTLSKPLFEDLRRRLRPICQRTLRRQVVEYVRYTNRVPITQDFTPTKEEQDLYDGVSEYLRRERLHALPASQRKLMTLVLRRLLASSSYAIAGTLQSLLERLRSKVPPTIEEDFESYPELKESWEDEPEPVEAEPSAMVADRADIEAEIRELAAYQDLAKSITQNAKGEALLKALGLGFDKLERLGAPRKAVIFTESRRTQAYLADLLERSGYAGKTMTFNGTNADKRSSGIYEEWKKRHAGEAIVSGSKAVDLRAALVEHFRDGASIMIATEAAAEGVNLQFCSLVVNYDLPWNPQRIEQRIGRCHRYGQKNDVVVINFLNRSNEADVRVFEILKEKFRLFDGVFGASDEVLGALESGVDFERRIAAIYQACRTKEEIDSAFDRLQSELEVPIQEKMVSARAQLLENFDADVHERLRLHKEETATRLDRVGRWFWGLARHELSGCAEFQEDPKEFSLTSAPVALPEAPLGLYRLAWPGVSLEGAHAYRPGHPLADGILALAAGRMLPPAHVLFELARHPFKVSVVEALRGKSGHLSLQRLSVEALEGEDHLLVAGVLDSGDSINPEVCERLFEVPGTVVGATQPDETVLETLGVMSAEWRQAVLAEAAERSRRFFEDDMDKCERWAEDLKHGLEAEISEMDEAIKMLKREARAKVALAEKVALHKRVKDAEAERARKRRSLFDAQDEVDRKKDDLIAETEARLEQKVTEQALFVIRWEVR